MKKYNFTEAEAQNYAKEKSNFVVICSFNDGNSNDERRESTIEEGALIERAIAAALIA